MRSLLLWSLLSATAFGEISVPSTVSPGQPIVATFEQDSTKQAAYDWSVSDGSVIPVDDGSTAHVWATSGSHTIDVAVAYWDGNTIQIQRHRATFRVTGAPVPGDLRSLLTDDQATTLESRYMALSEALASGRFSSVGVFRSVHTSAWRDVDAQKAKSICEQRINAALGLDDEAEVPVSTVKSVVDDIVLELRGNKPPTPTPPPTPDPTPPTPEEGPRSVLIVHDSVGRKPWFGSFIVQLRSSESVNAWWRNQGHVVTVLDDEKAEYRDEWKDMTLPVVLVMDKQTKKVLYKKELEKGVTPDNIIERIRETGG